MDITLLLLQLPGFGISKVKNFINSNSLFLEDEKYLKHYIRAETGKSMDFYLDRVKAIKENCYNLGVTIVKVEESRILYSPLILYLKGDERLLLVEKKLAVVGTRTPSRRSALYGKKFVSHAIKYGWTTVSGLARGCDTICHKESISCGGRTIAVIPGGYNKNIAPWLVERGLIISEYPPGSIIKKYRCVERNRIITGLSKGLYVIETKEGGGSEHSIRFAYRSNLPISYSSGFKSITKYGANKIENINQFDQYLKKCIK